MRSVTLGMLDRVSRRFLMSTSKAMMHCYIVYIERGLVTLKRTGIVCAHDKCHRLAVFRLGRNKNAVCGKCFHACPTWGETGEFESDEGTSIMMVPCSPLTCCSHAGDENA
jgi:hypothetical protein